MSSSDDPHADDRHERTSRACAHAALLAVGLLQYAVPAFSDDTWWLLLVILGLLLVPLRATDHSERQVWNQWLGNTTLVVIAVFVSSSLVRVVLHLHQCIDGDSLLRSAGAVWISNVLVFASIYWRLDGGGPHVRRRHPRHVLDGAFLFPQMTLPGGAEHWRPTFIDYLFVAFNTSTAFSPSDVPVLSHWAKVAMMVEAAIGLGTVGLVAARAINILVSSP